MRAHRDGTAKRVTRVKLAIGWAAECATLLMCGGARAQEEPPEARKTGADDKASSGGKRAVSTPDPAHLSVRGEGGFGPGSTGLGGRAGLSGEGWAGPYLGVGAFWGASSQSTVCVLCSTTSETLEFFGGAVAVRTDFRGSYGLFEIGAGYAWGHRETTAGFSLTSTAPPPTPTETIHAVLVDGCFAWLWHIGPIEIGPVFRVDVTTRGSALFAPSFALGFAGL